MVLCKRFNSGKAYYLYYVSKNYERQYFIFRSRHVIIEVGTIMKYN